MDSKTLCLKYGLGREEYIFNKLCGCISGLKRSKDRYAFFDFYQQSSRVLFELKSIQYAKTGFINTVIGTSKLDKYKHLVLFFEYENDNIFNLPDQDTHKLYYHIYDHTRKYNIRTITPKDRKNTCEVIDIPIHDLKLFDFDTDYVFDFADAITDTDTEIFESLINKYC